MTNHPDTPQPDPTAPPPESPGASTTPSAPVSGQPWSTPSGDPLSPEPYQPPGPASYAPGYAAIPEPEPHHYPPTSQFPAQQPVNYAPPGYAADYGHGYQPPPGYPPPPADALPPGYAPGYAPQPGYAPPGDALPPGYAPPPGYLPPQPPPKRSNAPIIAVIVAVTLLLCGGLATAGVLIAQNVTNKAKEAAEPYTNLPTEVPDVPGLPTDLPDNPQDGRTITVTYEVTGDGPASIAYVDALDQAPVRKTDVQLPWKFTTTMETPALLSVVAVRIGTSEGTVTCRALVDGDEVKKSTSNRGTVATASCIHLAFQ
ncbi:MmpS family transport accessory protein [Actinoplanes sp. CA-030573]|uniref:MmpS family transport accessory protein n=1 Tax=Actinoplanes sp. CA-030573 TaxID=3239898 RepID=UPI003D8DB885